MKTLSVKNRPLARQFCVLLECPHSLGDVDSRSTCHQHPGKERSLTKPTELFLTCKDDLNRPNEGLLNDPETFEKSNIVHVTVKEHALQIAVPAAFATWIGVARRSGTLNARLSPRPSSIYSCSIQSSTLARLNTGQSMEI
jgi:hypothetical protein